MLEWIEIELKLNFTITGESDNIQTQLKVVFLELFLQGNFVLYYPDVGMWNILVAKLYMPYYEEAEYGS